jgi:hypothetical protein
LLGLLLPPVLVLPLLLLGARLFRAPSLLRLLGVLLPPVLGLPLLLLSARLFRVPSLLRLLSMLLCGFGLLLLALFLLRMLLLFTLLLPLRISGSRDSEKHSQGRCAQDSNSFHHVFSITAGTRTPCSSASVLSSR